MKITLLNFYQGHIDRGAETFVQELSSQFAKEHKVLVISGSQKTVSVRDPITLFQRLFLDTDSVGICKWTFKQLRQLKEYKPDIIIPANGGWQALIISLFSRFTGSKMVVAGQSGPGWDDRWNLFCKPHAFVTLTQRQQEWAKKATPWSRHKIVKISNGVDLSKFKPAGKKIKLELQRPIILMVAATVPYKRVEQGIAAVAKLDKGSLLLLGTGPGDKRVDKLGYKLLGKEHFLHLSVSHHDMPTYYRSADLFTLCSASSEAFGIVYLEALASGLPCVVTDDASRREIVGESGVFVKDPDDKDEYSQAISQALKKNWGQSALKQAQKFSWDRISKKYLLLFKDMI